MQPTKNIVRVDTSKIGGYNGLAGHAVQSSRRIIYSDEKISERIKYSAVEGATLTMLGKVTYDVSKDEFTMTDALGFIGGGF